MNTVINFLFAAIKAGLPLLFGTTGESLTEKVGNLNLGVEGMVFMGAYMGFFLAFKTESLFLALVGAFLIGALGALVYAFLTVTLKANQTVTGLALTIFGSGFAKFFGTLMITANNKVAPQLPEKIKAIVSEKPLPVLGNIPYIGKLLFSHSIMVYVGIIIAVVVGLYLNKTYMGLKVKSVGENPAAADAAGINVDLMKYIHILIGGGICGLGGVYISLVNSGGIWDNGCVSGQGWISVALVIFVNWNPIAAIFGSILFGGLKVLRLYLPTSILPIAIYDMLPFVITAIVLIATSMRKSKEFSQPKSCGVNYFREER